MATKIQQDMPGSILLPSLLGPQMQVSGYASPHVLTAVYALIFLNSYSKVSAIRIAIFHISYEVAIVLPSHVK